MNFFAVLGEIPNPKIKFVTEMYSLKSAASRTTYKPLPSPMI